MDPLLRGDDAISIAPDGKHGSRPTKPDDDREGAVFGQHY